MVFFILEAFLCVALDGVGGGLGVCSGSLGVVEVLEEGGGGWAMGVFLRGVVA